MSVLSSNNGNKLGRVYQVFIQAIDGSMITVTQPVTIEFDITRNNLTSMNVCQIRLYNLAPERRNQLRFNGFNQGLYKTISLRAGYSTSGGSTTASNVASTLNTSLPAIFTGNISQASSVREGQDFITQIESFDGGFGFVNGDVNVSYPAGTPRQFVIEDLMSKIPNVTFGAAGIFPDVLMKKETYTGNPCQILYEMTGGAFFIDHERAYALKSSDFAPKASGPIIINADTGLLNTPMLEQSTITFEMIFEPTLDVGGLIILESLTYPEANGSYILNSVKHRGTISGAVSGNLTTTAQFYKTVAPIPASIIPVSIGA